MEKEFVPYTLALELKKLGFDEPCMSSRDMNNGKGLIQLPLYQQAFRWFREKYDINNCISYSRLEDNNWYYQYYKSGLDGGFETYEEAELACLEKLIELVEQKEK
jgi:hypothetical protein